MRTILDWYQSGGPFMIPLGAVSLAGLLILADRIRFIVLKSRINARPFIERVITLVRAGKLDDALKLCSEHESAIPDLGLVLLRSSDKVELQNVADAATLMVVPLLTKRLSWLLTLAMTAVLLGTLGAIVNLHEVLTHAVDTPAETRAVLLTGIAYALRPLGAGFLTAIPLVLGHTYLTNEAQTIIDQLKEFSVRLVNVLSDRPDVRLGHRS